MLILYFLLMRHHLLQPESHLRTRIKEITSWTMIAPQKHRIGGMGRISLKRTWLPITQQVFVHIRLEDDYDVIYLGYRLLSCSIDVLWNNHGSFVWLFDKKVERNKFFAVIVARRVLAVNVLQRVFKIGVKHLL